ncbi:hypothetical protein [Clostridium disporicum]|uniref:hypothetical protein n=1 Tax=Clostridium disporicum TaxID=84024 RepID=UPI0034A4F009
MVELLLLLFLYILFVGYWIAFTHITLNIAYIVNEKKNSSDNMNDSIRLFNIYKFLSYLTYVLLLIIFIVLSKYIDSVLGMFILNALWLLGIGFIKLNILLIDHLLNVLFIPNSLKTLEKELVIGCIEYNSGLKFKYRLKREMFNI